MLDIYNILNSTPIKDTVTLRINDFNSTETIKEIEITEEQLRWLQYNIAKGNYPYENVTLISKTGKKISFSVNGCLTSSIEGNNTMSLNDDLAMSLLTVYSGIMF